MKFPNHAQPIVSQRLAWLTAALVGAVIPAVTMLMVMDTPSPPPLATVGGPVLALGLMGVGMIAAAADGRLWLGLVLALLNGACLIVFARALGMAPLLNPISTAFVFTVASISFAARGALFARSASDRGWLIALFVVAGEAAILITASVEPEMLPEWLLVLLPAQWANIAIQTSLTGYGPVAASAALLALGGTAAATLLVARLWPKRWPYLLMLTTWLGLSALVWYWPALPIGDTDVTVSALAANTIALP